MLDDTVVIGNSLTYSSLRCLKAPRRSQKPSSSSLLAATRDKQIGDFLVAVAILGLGIVDQILDAVAAKRELALIGHDLSVDLVVAVHIRDASEARDHARAVGIAQAALDIVLNKQALVIRVGRQPW